MLNVVCVASGDLWPRDIEVCPQHCRGEGRGKTLRANEGEVRQRDSIMVCSSLLSAMTLFMAFVWKASDDDVSHL